MLIAILVLGKKIIPVVPQGSHCTKNEVFHYGFGHIY